MFRENFVKSSKNFESECKNFESVDSNYNFYTFDKRK